MEQFSSSYSAVDEARIVDRVTNNDPKLRLIITNKTRSNVPWNGHSKLHSPWLESLTTGVVLRNENSACIYCMGIDMPTGLDAWSVKSTTDWLRTRKRAEASF